ncbi:MAG: hypothetical protein EP320_18400 [Rhodobacteraceae bacterium]|uniref:Uncharacterized protein n=1 Tax=Thioclava marina TaxID=1915077 RepID=A0ABX3MMR7_9RHOB|nr:MULTISPECIES: hypothetical protein [Thioclava]OOY12835.1 hypothetical protein BMG00_03150 [Thioclava marina]OOY28059.1 hypothetical protein BMI90_09235 [Thioclava sp. L04-15]TNE86824.1 MAG: hypothetical protein EP337_11560 [Paracoccaceae bacterium]TNF10164.1 MAG: hypothetical protein EP320_18400 [Paracoccaceae bacterium]
MTVTSVENRRDHALHRILELGAEEVPGRIIEMRREKTLSKLIVEINAGLVSDNGDERARAQAALDRLGFI